MLSITSTHIFAVVLLAGFLPGAKANCWIDKYVYQSQSHIRDLFIPLNLIFLSPLLNDFKQWRRNL